MNAGLGGMKDTRVGRRHGAAVGNGSRLTLGSSLAREPLVGEAGARCAGVTVTVDAMLGGVEDARVCRRYRVTVSDGSWNWSVMNAGLAAMFSLEAFVLELCCLCDESISK